MEWQAMVVAIEQASAAVNAPGLANKTAALLALALAAATILAAAMATLVLIVGSTFILIAVSRSAKQSICAAVPEYSPTTSKCPSSMEKS